MVFDLFPERMLQGQDFIKHKPYTVHVDFGSIFEIFPSFGSHKSHVLGALEGVKARTFINELGNSKVSNLQGIAFDQNVVRLYIPMNELLIDSPRPWARSIIISIARVI